MKFQIGDKVLILHSNEEAEVVDIINDKMVMVDVRRVNFPAYIDQLDFPYFKRFSEKKLFPPKKEKKFIDQIKKDKSEVSDKNIPEGVWLVFLPQFDQDEFGDDVVENLKIHLVNHTDKGYQFNYQVNYFGKPEFDLNNQVYAKQDFYLHDLPFADLNDNPVFNFDFSLLNPEKEKAEHYEASIKIRPKQLFTKIQEIKLKGEATFSFLLFEKYPDKPYESFDTESLQTAGYKIYNAKEARQHLEPAKPELDLHIEKLTSDWQHLSSFEKLNLQLRQFEKYLDLAIAHHLPSMIAIHGVGSGRLKEDIHEILKYRKDVKSFINQYDPRYGYGATEIYFQY